MEHGKNELEFTHRTVVEEPVETANARNRMASFRATVQLSVARALRAPRRPVCPQVPSAA